MNRTLAGGNALKALGLTRSRNELSVLFGVLLNHLVRTEQHGLWNGDADLLRGFEVDHKLKLRRLLHG